MNIRRAYKTELDPNASQVSHFLRSAGAARWAWNQALAVNSPTRTGAATFLPRGLTYTEGLCIMRAEAPTWK